MAPVHGHATARLSCHLLLIVFTIYVVISYHISQGYVSAIRSYDRGSLFRIKYTVEALFLDWD